ncbi:acylphosphatase [Nocardioides coralli]|uniref:acylphosphatase n=1 Tax=Nocardioides coralli TaxID=2872154 RepID=UPI001CA458EB|nr:acylphosphatase [Nocardioides coralli]QZY29088.1 acylphosphatase [Nocardioides coralli]
MTRVRVVVSGFVQGVFFRESCRQEAGRQGVAGWVRNDAAGTVTAEFEGDPAAVEAMVAWCRRGPAHAAVEGVEATTLEPTGSTRFEVR